MNIDPKEIAKFDKFAAQWWDYHGPLKTLHAINPLRLKFIEAWVPLHGKTVLDVGCGGGILSESLASAGAITTAIDGSEHAITVAKNHAQKQGLIIDYHCTLIESFCMEHPSQFDVITCLELLEHVPDPAAIITACAEALKPGGTIFFSTINRNVKAYLHAIIGAEYLLNMLPKGTHDFSKFIKPSELNRAANHANLELFALQGMGYQISTDTYSLNNDVSVNYLAAFRKLS